MGRQYNHKPLKGWKIDGEKSAERKTYLTKNEYLILLHQPPSIINYSFPPLASTTNLCYFIIYVYVCMFYMFMFSIYVLCLCTYSFGIYTVYVYVLNYIYLLSIVICYLYKLVSIVPQMIYFSICEKIWVSWVEIKYIISFTVKINKNIFIL